MNTKNSFPNIVGLSGYAQSGKSTVSDFLVKANGYTRIKFADGLKNMLRVIGLTEVQIEGEEKETPCKLLCDQTPRYAMQTLGTEWGRRIIGEDLWVNIWEYLTSAALVTGKRVVVDDIRFLNELYAVQRLGGMVIRITRPGYGPLNPHLSESSLEAVIWKHILYNHCSKAGLYKNLVEMLYTGE